MVKRVSIGRRVAAQVAAVLMVTGGIVIANGSTEPASAAGCLRSHQWYKFDNIRRNNAFAIDYAYIRSNPYAGCSRVGWGHRWHDINMHCWVLNDVGKLWFHIWDRDTQVKGWTYLDNLRGDLPAPKYNCDEDPWVEV